MTNQEAIKILEVAKAECEWNAPLEYQGAFNKAIEALQLHDVPAEPEQRWIPVSERLPEAEYPVIVTWMNNDPASYYQYILGKHYTGVAHYKNSKWYWYSSVTEDVLMEYGKYDSEEFDEAIEVIAWMPLPEPYKAERRMEVEECPDKDKSLLQSPITT